MGITFGITLRIPLRITMIPLEGHPEGHPGSLLRSSLSFLLILILIETFREKFEKYHKQTDRSTTSWHLWVMSEPKRRPWNEKFTSTLDIWSKFKHASKNGRKETGVYGIGGRQSYDEYLKNDININKHVINTKKNTRNTSNTRNRMIYCAVVWGWENTSLKKGNTRKDDMKNLE